MTLKHTYTHARAHSLTKLYSWPQHRSVVFMGHRHDTLSHSATDDIHVAVDMATSRYTDRDAGPGQPKMMIGVEFRKWNGGVDWGGGVGGGASGPLLFSHFLKLILLV